ncbi:hypothetical protein [Clavibacter phaseoli]|uniref:hypothetical protein n=1 Tax=Clavibacter phaseoli TaxID=1734031 RepID=UPI000E673CDC|nr:hypothetical protein [Clavibacter phaseoli]RIJ53810.1 hypothetical protein DZF99_13900 [Clavibacter phaseoli]UKF30297.1 hypothetical protein FGD69_04170 [Clavibacter phaseoli]UKF36215.1 hypothetical protein FGI33_03550 [Clavibacter phaseoli]
MTPTAPDRGQPLFRRVRRAWHDAPSVAPALAFAVLVFAWLWALDLDRPPEGTGTVILRAVVALVAGAAMAGARRLTRSHHPGSPSDVEVSEAAEDGGLPAGADPTAWQDALDRRRRRIRQEAWGVPVALVLVVGLAFLAPHASEALPVAYVAFLALFVPYAASQIVSRQRRRDSVDALLIPLQERARAEEERRAGWAPPSPHDRIPPAAG